jgi:hypothetical protein
MGRRRQRGFEAQKPEDRLGDAPVEERYHDQMNAIMLAVDDFLNGKERPRKTGIVIMMFPYGEDPAGRCNYMSNGANRKDIVSLMKEMTARFEGQPEVKGRA